MGGTQVQAPPQAAGAETEASLRRKFNQFDRDGDGVLSRDEVAAMVVSLGYDVDDDYGGPHFPAPLLGRAYHILAPAL